MAILSELVYPSVPEPITRRNWRRAALARVIVCPILAICNAAGWFWAVRQGEEVVAIFLTFLTMNVAAHAADVILNLGLLKSEPSEATWRHAARVSAVLEIFTGIVGLWVLGSVTSFTYLFLVVLVAFYRLYLDGVLGAWTWGVVMVQHTLLVLGEVAGWWPPHPADPALALVTYTDESTQLLHLGFLLLGYTTTWVIASMVAIRVRRTEHALRSLAEDLEERVATQVSALERSARLRRYLPPQVVERVLSDDVDPGSVLERREISVLFADLMGFTGLEAAVSPEILANLLNRYFEVVAAVIFHHGGTVDKFLGDGVMAFFGAPGPLEPAESARRCVAAAREVQDAIFALQGTFHELGSDRPLVVRVGIGSGSATVGAFGTGQRADYTAIGEPVNRAARLEALCPGGSILVDAQTRDLLGDGVPTQEHGMLTLKGFPDPQQVFKVLRSDEEETGPRMVGPRA